VTADHAHLLQKRLDARRRPEKDVTITGIVSSIAHHARRTHDRLGELVELWEAAIPAHLSARTRLTALRGGILHVDVDSPATLYEIDRLLRGGVEDQLRAAHRGTLTRVKLKVATLE
jgi:hypothetical protein